MRSWQGLLNIFQSNINSAESQDEAVHMVVDGSKFQIDEAGFRVKMVSKLVQIALCISVDENLLI